MSFSPSNNTKQAENNLRGTSNLALNSQFPKVEQAGSDLLGLGGQTTAPGVSFFNTLLAGNQPNTTAALQPSIDQIRQGNSGVLNSINTLTPRGGGRSGALFGQSFAPQGQIQNLFNGSRTAAATALPQIGLQESQLGQGFFGLGNNALNAATGANQVFANNAQQDRQTSLALASGIANSVFKLATTPFGGGSASGGLLGLIGGSK